jgi:hypothetical protein
MERDTFTAGVVPGGLTDHKEIKILLCHVLCEPGFMFHDDLLEALTGLGYANYFECADALAGLVAAGHIRQDDTRYSILESGREIARTLIDDVPLTVRERVEGSARTLVRRARNRNSHKVGIIETDLGYRVRCTVCDSMGNELFAVELDAPNQRTAQVVRDNFVDQAEDIMRYCITILTGGAL